MTIKRLVKILIWPLLLLSLWFIIPHKLFKKEKPPYADYISYVNEVRERFADQMHSELHLICVGDSGKMDKKVEEMGLQFKTYQRATIDEARALELHVIENFVQAINAHPNLQPYLAEHPFTYERVVISISFESPLIPRKDDIAWVHNIPNSAGAIENRNKLFYYTLDPITGKLIDLFEEPYDKASFESRSV